MDGNYQLSFTGIFTYKVTNVTTGLLELLFLFVDKDRHSSLWLEGKTFETSQRGYLRSEATTVHSSQRPQRLESHKILDSGQLAM